MESITRYKIKKGPIPKIIHMVWLGPFTPPLEWMETWSKDFCPKYGWEYKLWTEKELQKVGIINQQAFDDSVSYQQKSDIVRYEIIYRYGGLYLDCDMVYIGTNIEDYIPFSTTDFVGVQESPSSAKIGAPYCANGFFAAIAGHPALKDMIDLIPSRIKMRTEHAWVKTGPKLFNLCIKSPITILPHKWVFPLDFHYQHNVKDPKIFKDKALMFTYNGNDYSFVKKLRNLEKFGNCNG